MYIYVYIYIYMYGNKSKCKRIYISAPVSILNFKLTVPRSTE